MKTLLEEPHEGQKMHHPCCFNPIFFNVIFSSSGIPSYKQAAGAANGGCNSIKGTAVATGMAAKFYSVDFVLV